MFHRDLTCSCSLSLFAGELPVPHVPQVFVRHGALLGGDQTGHRSAGIMCKCGEHRTVLWRYYAVWCDACVVRVLHGVDSHCMSSLRLVYCPCLPFPSLTLIEQPIPAGFFPIRAGDTVISPMGPFLVQSVFEVPAPVADPSCADREDGLEDSGGLVTMCKGQLVAWPLAQGRPASATFRRSALRKDDRVTVLCYDCSHRGATPFHFLGLECQGCHGFNTARV